TAVATLSLHDALPICEEQPPGGREPDQPARARAEIARGDPGLCVDPAAGGRARGGPSQPFRRARGKSRHRAALADRRARPEYPRSEEHTSALQSPENL